MSPYNIKFNVRTYSSIFVNVKINILVITVYHNCKNLGFHKVFPYLYHNTPLQNLAMLPVVILPLKKVLLSPSLMVLTEKFSPVELHRTKEHKHIYMEMIL